MSVYRISDRLQKLEKSAHTGEAVSLQAEMKQLERQIVNGLSVREAIDVLSAHHPHEFRHEDVLRLLSKYETDPIQYFEEQAQGWRIDWAVPEDLKELDAGEELIQLLDSSFMKAVKRKLDEVLSAPVPFPDDGRYETWPDQSGSTAVGDDLPVIFKAFC